MEGSETGGAWVGTGLAREDGGAWMGTGLGREDFYVQLHSFYVALP